jgi:hypothetical protein
VAAPRGASLSKAIQAILGKKRLFIFLARKPMQAKGGIHKVAGRKHRSRLVTGNHAESRRFEKKKDCLFFHGKPRKAGMKGGSRTAARWRIWTVELRSFW